MMRQISTITITLLLLACQLFTVYAGNARIQPDAPPGQSLDSQHRSLSEAETPRTDGQVASDLVPDAEVFDQNGMKVHFYSDLIKGKSVVINFIFTSCSYICPLQGAAFSKLQAALDDRVGNDVFLISISTDPLTDTPERLRAWGRRFGAKAGWTFVTGEKAQMDLLLKALTGDVSGRQEHSPFVLILNCEKGLRVRANAFAAPEAITKYFDGNKTGPGKQPVVEKTGQQ